MLQCQAPKGFFGKTGVNYKYGFVKQADYSALYKETSKEEKHKEFSDLLSASKGNNYFS